MNTVPLQQKGPDQEIVTQFDGTTIEKLGLLKMDFLGLRNLDVIDKAVELVPGLDISTIPLDDKRTYEMLARGESIGVFQFEGSGMREALRSIKPTVFDDLIAIGALYRPGPMAYIPVYARRKNGKEPVTYPDERLKPITAATYGICIYQEQYMEIAKQIAGFSPAEADDLRKAIGKKIHSLMASLKSKFLEGCAASGTAAGVAQQLWADMEQAQDYSFNKSHAACYALISYRTAWLRANHPREYMAALISSVMNTKDKVPFYVAACDELGIEVLPPDVNESQVDFAVVEGKIRFGLNAVKNVGEATCRAIVAAREEGGPFASIWDFTERVDPSVANKRSLESLVSSGALDSTGASRKGMLHVLEDALSYGQKQQQDRLLGQASIFDLGDSPAASSRHHATIPDGEFEKAELLRMEKESLGLYVSEHPLSAIRDQLRRRTDCTLAELERRREGETVLAGGIVAGVRTTTTKKGEPMAFVQLEDVTGSVEVVVFNSTYAAARELLVEDAVLVVKGRVDHKQQGETKLSRSRSRAFEAVPERREVRLKVDARSAPAGVIRELGGRRARLPGRGARLRRPRHLARPEAPRARPRVPRRPAAGLLRLRAAPARRRRGPVTDSPAQIPPEGEIRFAADSRKCERTLRMNTAAHEIIETELERVERWRTAELMRVGFAGDDAVALAARTDVDLHQAIELVQRGCPPELAVPHPRLTWTVAGRRGHNACS